MQAISRAANYFSLEMILDSDIEVERVSPILEAESNECGPAVITDKADNEVSTGIKHTFNRHAGVGLDGAFGEEFASVLVLQLQKQALTRRYKAHAAGPIGSVQFPIRRSIAPVGCARGDAVDENLVLD